MNTDNISSNLEKIKDNEKNISSNLINMRINEDNIALNLAKINNISSNKSCLKKCFLTELTLFILIPARAATISSI